MTNLFVILLDVPAEAEDDFNRIYDTDHLRHMMQVPGIHRCDRYRLDWSDNDDMNKYLAIYEISDPDLPKSAEWKHQAGQGRWPTEMRHRIARRANGAYRQIADHRPAGAEGGDHLYFLQQSVPAEIDARFNHLYDTDHIPLMLQAPGALGCRRFRLEWSETGGVPDYLALYDIACPEIPRSEAWKAQTSKGAWPTEMRPRFTARRNGAFTRIAEFSAR